MPNPFGLNVITPAGAALIAQATAANQIVFTSALSGTTAATDAADLAGKTAAFYDGVSGSIDACSATGNLAKIVSRFGNAGANPQAVKSVCILGRMASQSAGSEIIIAAMSDADSEIVLPSSASPSQITRFPFNFSITDGGTIETAYADGATLSDLERFVSMHKAGDPTQGEDQTIKGDKTFDGYCYFNDDVIFQDPITISSDGSVFSGFEVVGDVKIGSDAENPANLTVYGECNLYGTVTCGNDITTIGDAEIGNDLLVNGSTTLLGDLSCENINCEGITGLAPSVSNGVLNVPIGGYVFIWSSELITISNDIEVGDELVIPANTCYSCKWSGLGGGPVGAFSKGSLYIPYGRYVAIMGSYMADGGTNAPILFVRIET